MSKMKDGDAMLLVRKQDISRLQLL